MGLVTQCQTDMTPQSEIPQLFYSLALGAFAPDAPSILHLSCTAGPIQRPG
jgi:hypothetical protein